MKIPLQSPLHARMAFSEFRSAVEAKDGLFRRFGFEGEAEVSSESSLEFDENDEDEYSLESDVDEDLGKNLGEGKEDGDCDGTAKSKKADGNNSPFDRSQAPFSSVTPPPAVSSANMFRLNSTSSHSHSPISSTNNSPLSSPIPSPRSKRRDEVGVPGPRRGQGRGRNAKGVMITFGHPKWDLLQNILWGIHLSVRLFFISRYLFML